MFESLSDRLTETLGKLSRKGRLTEADVDDAMKEVRRALLEADVNFRVVKDFVSAVRERAVGQDVLKSLTPAQTVIGIVHEELVRVLGTERNRCACPIALRRSLCWSVSRARERQRTRPNWRFTCASRAETRSWSPAMCIDPPPS